jgi:hypothetical protein
LILDVLDIKKDLTNALQGFEKSFIPMQLLFSALVLSFRLRCAPYANDAKELVRALRYHVYEEEVERQYFEDKLKEWRHMQPATKNSKFWAQFLLRYAPALTLFHRAIRQGEPKQHQIRYEKLMIILEFLTVRLDCLNVFGELFDADHKINYQDLVAETIVDFEYESDSELKMEWVATYAIGMAVYK